MPHGTTISVENLIAKNTLFSLYQPFLPLDRAIQVSENMLSDRGKGIFHQVGAMASSIPALKFLRYCNRCVETDLQEFGEAYWHRVHQVTGITACPIHSCKIYESNIGVSPPQNKTAFYILPNNITTCGNKRIETVGFPHSNVAEAVQCLLDNQVVPLGLEKIRERYITLLQKNDFATFRGRVSIKDLVEAINGFYSTQFLHEIYSSIDSYQSDNWLTKMVRKPRSASHPVRHILLMLFLGVTPKEFFAYHQGKMNPFGIGPWPCLNPACENHNKNVIQSCQVTRGFKTGKPVGTFFCQCGFVYAREGPDKDSASRYKIGRIKAFGEKWHQKMLFFLTKEKYSILEIARRLKVDPSTIKHQALIFLGEKTTIPKSRKSINGAYWLLRTPRMAGTIKPGGV